MKTTAQWWTETKNNPELLMDWLKDQYHGEATAATRIRDFSNQFATTDLRKEILECIAIQEERHAGWVGDLLKARGCEPALLIKPERYWDQTLPEIDSFESGCAVAAHAEAMRLERIECICYDSDAPADIREVFMKIFPEEKFHARAFRNLTTYDAMQKTDEAHVKGLEAIGLVL